MLMIKVIHGFYSAHSSHIPLQVLRPDSLRAALAVPTYTDHRPEIEFCWALLLWAIQTEWRKIVSGPFPSQHGSGFSQIFELLGLGTVMSQWHVFFGLLADVSL
jgi:hypothetical protein